MDTENADLFGSDGEQIPFIFVPHGAPESLEWMVRHPDWVKIPATMVPRGRRRGGSALDGAGRGDGVSGPPVLVAWGDSPSTVMTPSSVPMSGGDIGTFMEARPEDRSSAAVVAFLKVNRALERVADRPDDSTAVGVPMVDDQGRRIIGGNGKPALRPAGLDPHMFVAHGLRDRAVVQSLFPGGGMTAGMAAFGYQTGILAKFAWGNSWDAQRVGGRFQDECRDYSTIAIGLYAGAAGLSRAQILTIQNFAAAAGSRFGNREEMDQNYRYLPSRNVRNTDIGYGLFASGRVGENLPGNGRPQE